MRVRLPLLLALLGVLSAPVAAQNEVLFLSSYEATESLMVSVDPALSPRILTQPGFEGAPARPVALMETRLGDGYDFHFMENEIVLITDNPQDLTALQSRWPSTLLEEADLDMFEDGSTQDRLYVLQVDPSSASPELIRDNLEGLIPELAGIYSVSSDTALRLLALVSIEIADHGLRVGINPVLETDALAQRSIEEAALGDTIMSGSLSFTYQSNPFRWPYAKREDQFPSGYPFPLNAGAAEALRVVNAETGLIGNVRVMIADAGFFPNEDFPTFTSVNGLRGTNPVGCGNGPPAPGSVCATHGTHVAMSGFARINNQFGTFGPGGEVSELLLLQSPSLDFAGFVRYVTEGIREFRLNPPQIINISAGVSVPGGWCFLACEPLDLVVDLLRDRDILVIASAGNDGIDVDSTDQFCIGACVEFEAAAIVPCEIDGVLCVGATTSFQTLRTGYSNFGSSGADGNSVDLYAPGNVYSIDAIAADSDNAMPIDDLQIITGTSFSTPFSAGVLALTMSSDPGTTAIQAESCLLNTAFRPFSGLPLYRSINAVGAVACAMGGSHPFVEVISPTDGRVLIRGTQNLELVGAADDYEQGSALNIQWTSSLDGGLGSSNPGAPINPGLIGMSVGDHEICARVTDNSGRLDTDCVDIEVRSSPPIVTITQPLADPATFFVSQAINLAATATDLDGPNPTGADVAWFIAPFGGSYSSVPTATGLNATVPGDTYSPGTYGLKLEVTDSDGVLVQRFQTINIVDNPTNLPPSVNISAPMPGERRLYDNQPVRFNIEAEATDPEDVTLPFTSIRWFVSRQGGAFQERTLETFQFCFQPPFGPPQCGPITYYLDIEPVNGASTTSVIIRPRVEDSGGVFNNTVNDQVTVFIDQIL
ncbi:MAG: S8/S53 family peptidase [Pseudomonadota bacterium]